MTLEDGNAILENKTHLMDCFEHSSCGIATKLFSMEMIEEEEWDHIVDPEDEEIKVKLAKVFTELKRVLSADHEKIHIIIDIFRDMGSRCADIVKCLSDEIK